MRKMLRYCWEVYIGKYENISIQIGRTKERNSMARQTAKQLEEVNFNEWERELTPDQETPWST